MEQLVLFPERLILLIDMRLRDLEGHILVCDFRDIGEEEDAREQEDKYTDGEVDPLHALQGGYIVFCLGEENIRAQHWADDCADGVEGLGEVDSDFGVAGRTAD